MGCVVRDTVIKLTSLAETPVSHHCISDLIAYEDASHEPILVSITAKDAIFDFAGSHP